VQELVPNMAMTFACTEWMASEQRTYDKIEFFPADLRSKCAEGFYTHPAFRVSARLGSQSEDG
jgi:hypothetical protein